MEIGTALCTIGLGKTSLFSFAKLKQSFNSVLFKENIVFQQRVLDEMGVLMLQGTCCPHGYFFSNGTLLPTY